MLLGIWKNVEELEECLNIRELELVVSAGREKEERRNKFMAALQGIDLDGAGKEDAKKKFDEVQQRVRARQEGKSEEELAFGDLGIDIIRD